MHQGFEKLTKSQNMDRQHERKLKELDEPDSDIMSHNSGNGKQLVVKLLHRSSGSIFHRTQFSSLILFLSVIIFLNLCPFQSDFELEEPTNFAHQEGHSFLKATTSNNQNGLLRHVESCLKFMQLMFTNPIRLNKRDTTRFMQAQAKVLGKVAKMWYIKKKIKKLSKKLKKHTIAVPVFTAIPIYEHSYYPSPYVTHVTHGGGGMHHAASTYVPTVTQMSSPLVASQSQQQMVTSASNNHHMAYARVAAPPPQHHHHNLVESMGGYQPMASASHHQIINAYAPSPPLFVDEAGGLYGQYGNSYGRYDGGYHIW